MQKTKRSSEVLTISIGRTAWATLFEFFKGFRQLPGPDADYKTWSLVDRVIPHMNGFDE